MITASPLSWLRTAAATGAFVALGLVGAAVTARAQGPIVPTPEGTVITNIAYVNYTDANGNSYAQLSDTVSVTVGFKAGIDVTGATSVTPASPSTNDTLTFVLHNTGNGTDTMNVAVAYTGSTTVMTNIGYVYNGVEYPSVAALQAVLDTVSVPAGDSIIVKIVYDVPIGQGGLTETVTLTDTSQRDPTVYDSQATNVSPPISGSIMVTPDGELYLQKLPTSGETYTQTFWVHNNQTTADVFDLVASTPGSPVIEIVSVNSVAGTTATSPSIAAGDSAMVTVVYTVNDVAAGSTDTLYLQATSQPRPSVTDNGFADLTVIRPALTVTKEVFRLDQSTPIDTAGRVLPGEYIWYKITVENGGTAPASNVVIRDTLPSALTFIEYTQDGPTWDFTGSSGNYVTSALSGTLAVGGTRYIWIKAQVK